MNEGNITLNTDINPLIKPKWYSRFVAHIIDSFISSILILPITAILFLIIFVLGVFQISLFKDVTSLGTIQDSDKLSYLLGNMAFSISNFIIISIFTLTTYLVISWYYAYLQSKKGQTWGMQFVGIKITDINGELISFKQAYKRSLFFHLIPAIFYFVPLIDFIMGPIFNFIAVLVIAISILINEKGQGIHDNLFKTLVSSKDEKIRRAKGCLGCYCGCLFIPIIGAIASLIIMLITQGGEIPKLLENPKSTTNTPKLEMVNESLGEDEKIFYESCVNEGKNSPEYAFDNYCSCAAKEYTKTQNVNDAVLKCKDQIETKKEKIF